MSAIPNFKTDPLKFKDSYIMKNFYTPDLVENTKVVNSSFFKLLGKLKNVKILDLSESKAIKNIPFSEGKYMYFDK
ncbi:hypothetical protein ID852_20250 [Xenorhabdus sp. 42]|uniref:hypothetical protein n=1 Tax=Xenorhabdus szentirmaii TaxID=290112 RepID=UPI0019C9D887|nr:MULTISPECIES: hypothetical protein [unclassified Xenorhabdus]MBD2807165.1 hypothetical protein [Xenorhabdus sp. ZM]MBD2822947.1 hypothetical protein [Xenorhabdus sp. 42]